MILVIRFNFKHTIVVSLNEGKQTQAISGFPAQSLNTDVGKINYMRHSLSDYNCQGNP